MKRPNKRGCRRVSQAGFALLFIYAMAATVAIMLLMALPRVAFEAQRDKEQLLIDRGEQYSRAINLFVRKFNRYPADFDALQSTQNLRFLRHRYIDPMTGKDDWRIIHVGPGGVFTDSLVYNKPKTGTQQPADQQNFIMELPPAGGNQTGANQQGANVGTRQRPSDQPGAPGDPNNPNPLPQFDANGQPIQQPIQPGFPGQFQPGAGGTLPGAQLPLGQQFPNGPQFQNGQQAQNGQQFPNGQPVQMTPAFPNGVPFPQQGGFQPPNGAPTAAGNLINQLLTTPRPGGLNGLGGIQQGVVDPNANPNPNANATLANPAGAPGTPVGQPAGQTIGGGMAGVATKFEQDGIKVYKDQTSYNKWEFVYDITKDPARTGGAVPQGAPPPGTPIGTPPTGGAPGAPATTPTTPGNPAFNGVPPPPPPPVMTPPTQ